MQKLSRIGRWLEAGLSRIWKRTNQPERHFPAAATSCRLDPLESRCLLSAGPLPQAFGLISFSIVDAAPALEGHSGTARAALFTVNLPGLSTNPVSVQFATEDGTAEGDVDYVPVSGSLVFKRGERSKSFAVPLLGDTIQEGNETFYVNLSMPVGAPIARGRAVATIVDDDQPVVTIKAIDAKASEAGGNTGTYRIWRTGSTAAPMKVSYTVKGTATNTIDYTRLRTSAIIPAGQSFVDVSVSPIGDALKEKDETVVLSLLGKKAYVVGNAASATITIANAETTPPAAKLVSAPPLAAATAQPYRFTVRYSDNKALDLLSLDDGDLLVTGPGGYSQYAHLVSRTAAGSGRSIVATYSIPAPGGSWDNSDNGTYTLSVVASQIRDKAGNALVSGGLGTFTVGI